MSSHVPGHTAMPTQQKKPTIEIHWLSLSIKNWLSIPVMAGLPAQPHAAKTPYEHPVCCVIGAPVIVFAHKMLEAHEEHQVSQDGRAADE